MARVVTITCDNCGERQLDGAAMYALQRSVIARVDQAPEARITPVPIGEPTEVFEICVGCAIAAADAMTPALLARRTQGGAPCARA